MKRALYVLALLVLIAGQALAAPTGTGPGKSLSVDDRLQIQDLISRYGYAYDNRDTDGFLGLVTADIVWEAYANGVTKPLFHFTGRDELRTALAQRFALLQQRGIQSRHFQTNTLLVMSPNGAVEGTTMLNLAWQVTNEKPALVTTGIYHDLFVKTDAGWRIARRSLFMDQGELGK